MVGRPSLKEKNEFICLRDCPRKLSIRVATHISTWRTCSEGTNWAHCMYAGVSLYFCTVRCSVTYSAEIRTILRQWTGSHPAQRKYMRSMQNVEKIPPTSCCRCSQASTHYWECACVPTAQGLWWEHAGGVLVRRILLSGGVWGRRTGHAPASRGDPAACETYRECIGVLMFWKAWGG